MTGSRNRLLLVDDEPLIAMTLAEALRRASFDVSVTTSPDEGLGLARATAFSLVILDYAMPGRDGLATAAELATLRRPFMFLSAYSDERLVESAIAAGALAYVVKPIDPQQLVPTVRAAVTRAGQIAELRERSERMAQAIESNRDVSVAVGLLMAQRGVSRQIAYETLRQHARRSRRRLQDVAADVTGGADFVYGLEIATLKRTGDAEPGTTG